MPEHPRGVLVARVIAPPYLVTLVDTTAARCELAGFPLGVASHFHSRDDFPVVQVCWPDPAYRMPWHASYDGGEQKLLGDEPPPIAP